MSHGNGNKFKGNNEKKAARGRKNQFADFNQGNDQYAKIISIEGGRHLKVVPLDSIDNQPMMVLMKGVHHKKVWFKKDEIIVISDGEVKGRVNENEMRKIRTRFDIKDNDKDNSLIFGGDDMSDDDDDDDNKGENTKKTSGVCVAEQRKIDFDLEKIDNNESQDSDQSEEEIDIDAI